MDSGNHVKYDQTFTGAKASQGLPGTRFNFCSNSYIGNSYSNTNSRSATVVQQQQFCKSSSATAAQQQ